MQHERQKMADFNYADEVPDDEPKSVGKVPIRAGWVIIDKGDRVRARMVACQVAYNRWGGTFAATPTPMSIRLLCQQALAREWPIRT